MPANSCMYRDIRKLARRMQDEPDRRFLEVVAREFGALQIKNEELRKRIAIQQKLLVRYGEES